MENQENIEKEESKKNLSVYVAILLIFIAVCTIFSVYLINKKNKTPKFVQNAALEQSDSSAPKMLIFPKKPIFKEGEKYNFIIKKRIAFRGNFNKVKLSVGIPVNVSKRQKITDLQISPVPNKIIDNGDKKFAVYYYKNPPSNVNITYKGTAMSRTYTSDKAIKINRNIDEALSEKDFKMYTKSENGIESDNSKIKSIAETIPNGKDRMQTVKNIFDFVDNYLRYEKNVKNSRRGAKAAVFTKSGTCSEFSALFVAICRAKKIPAKVIYGFNLPFEDNVKNEYYAHAWLEVWFDEYGWVNFDPTISYDTKIIQYIKKHNLSYFDVVNASTFYRNYLIFDDSDIHVDYDADDRLKVGLKHYADKVIFSKKH